MEGEVGFEPTVRVRDGVTARRPFLQNVSPMVRSARLERALSSNSALDAAGLPIPPRSHGRRRAIRTLTSLRRPGLSRLGLPNSPSHRYFWSPRPDSNWLRSGYGPDARPNEPHGHGHDGAIRTRDARLCRPLPYRLGYVVMVRGLGLAPTRAAF